LRLIDAAIPGFGPLPLSFCGPSHRRSDREAMSSNRFGSVDSKLDVMFAERLVRFTVISIQPRRKRFFIASIQRVFIFSVVRDNHDVFTL